MLLLPGNPSEDPVIFHPSHVTPDWTYKPSQDLEEMNRQLLAELDVSSSDSSPGSTPIQDPTDRKTTQKTR